MKRWNVLDRIIKQNGFNRCAELGVKEGRLTSFLLANNPNLHMVAVDLFAPIDRPDSPGVERYDDWDFDAIKKEFFGRIEQNQDRVQFLQMTTTDAAKQVDDGSLDMVFIDAGHDYDSVREDIANWLPKVRPGCIVAGHDYQQRFPGVQRAVAEMLPIQDVHLESDSVWWLVKK